MASESAAAVASHVDAFTLGGDGGDGGGGGGGGGGGVSGGNSNAAAMASPSSNAGKPRFYLILINVSKKNNVGTILRSASAFNVSGILCVGARKRRDVTTFGAHGADRRCAFFFFDTLDECVRYAKADLGCIDVVGVEITASSVSLCDPACFRGSTALMMGNEGTGIDPAHAKLCDRFAFIPQYGLGTASLNVAVAAGIVFHRFASWAGYEERSRQGEKFVVGDVRAGMDVGDTMVHEQRQARRAQRVESDSEALNLVWDV